MQPLRIGQDDYLKRACPVVPRALYEVARLVDLTALDRCGLSKGPTDRLGQRDGEDLIDTFQDRAGDPGPVSFKTLGEVADQLFGFVGIVQLPCLSQHTPDRSMQRFG